MLRSSPSVRSRHSGLIPLPSTASKIALRPSATRQASSTAGGAGEARSRPSRFAKDAGLTLEHFLTRSKVIGLYRSFIRNTKGLGDLRSRQETVSWIRTEFEQHKLERDLAKIKSLLASGKRQLKQLSSSGMLVGVEGDKFKGSRKV